MVDIARWFPVITLYNAFYLALRLNETIILIDVPLPYKVRVICNITCTKNPLLKIKMIGIVSYNYSNIIYLYKIRYNNSLAL